MGTAAKHRLASFNNATFFAGLTLVVVALLVIALPGAFPADAGHTGVTLIGP
jgi:hypothetical protein